ncbi:hypothetical protein BDV32DRAFT_124218 [Aspergillus pseudonomiae]|uniref:Uncharacterized protein n=1 Tax=Aspergillus pseudonomiae TaxID=1506151 RepID=A0A5N7CZJ4_9EURO|nr:uncharacterized protein BDV37DRAFT_229951 [Aspergillus pseudonomiae]KAB8259645.1 hypothetical protein BDV32DRAFT_124218 [Aspergillus pseudonomiae]KAE8399459.1 hypothetical protein BDV37DRAFT_229951 [Aspergillus pseudonomiae]
MRDGIDFVTLVFGSTVFTRLSSAMANSDCTGFSILQTTLSYSKRSKVCTIVQAAWFMYVSAVKVNLGRGPHETRDLP